MVKLSLSSSSVGAISLAAIGAADASSSHFNKSPAAVNQLHHQLVRQTVRDVLPLRQNRLLQDEATEENCPGTPFLWKIIEDATGRHAGFGVGTMHLPFDIVATPEATASIMAAIEDSCDVYGELNFFDPTVAAALGECAESIIASAATVDDIPDEQLKEEIKAKMMEVGTLMSPDDPESAELLASRLLTLPLLEVMNTILYANTPEYAEKYLESLYSTDIAAMDMSIMAVGRPANDLEEVSTQCEILDQINPSAEEIVQSWDVHSANIKESLNGSLSKDIQMYRCGDIDAWLEELNKGMTVEMTDLLLAGRNEDMAQEMTTILNANTEQRVMFVVGLSHWIVGDNSFEALLKDAGYTLEHIPEWSSERAEDHSNEHCEVMYEPETGLFLSADPELFVPAPSPQGSPAGFTKEPTHSVVGDVIFTTPPSYEIDNGTGLVEIAEPTASPTSGGVSTVLGSPKMVLGAAASFIYYCFCA